MASAMDYLYRVPVVGETLKGLSGQGGLETAAAGAREAQAQAQQLSQLQWQRQMQGLDQARGQTQPYLSLYDKIYGTQMAGRQQPPAGGGQGGGQGGGYGPTQPGTQPGSIGFGNIQGNRRPDGSMAPDSQGDFGATVRGTPGLPGQYGPATFPVTSGGASIPDPNHFADYLRNRPHPPPPPPTPLDALLAQNGGSIGWVR